MKKLWKKLWRNTKKNRFFWRSGKLTGPEESSIVAFGTAESCVLSEGFEVESLENSGKEGAIEVSPCASERGKVMVELDLSEENKPFLDMETLCLLLDSYKSHFADLKCSTNLGVARFMWKARRIYVYEKGKFKIRFAHSREDAERVMDSLSRLILGSILCGECSEPSVECALGQCRACLTETPTTVTLEDSFNAPILLRGVKTLRESVEKFQALENYSFSEKWPEQMDKGLKRNLKEIIESGMNFALQTRNLKDLRIGTTMIAVARGCLLTLDLERELVENKEPEIPERLEELLDKLHMNIWHMQKSIVRGFFGESRTGSKRGDEKGSAALEILSEITSSRSRIFGKIDKDVLENFEKRVKKIIRCDRLLKNTGFGGS
ncbi:hypothetical protein AKJ36_03395 [candidate division MSBL1 archaeon SCGC-AAA259I07]|uniref:Uncharacterized protein n=1 Tax=candidate division MSBL1 archaeon SCGC-AAA259I07 TaxID=1698266 RepID=A0A133UJ24_9EURY|nr:hypothetical protein AKJ36_03395 [candidate division MSBL1 archaeon SCGC-AAA259I07]